MCYEEKTSNFFNDYSDYDYPRNSNNQESSNNENENNEDKTEQEENKKNENENVNLWNLFYYLLIKVEDNETENDKKNSEYDLGDFEFVDEHNTNEGDIEKILLLSPGKNLRVDEITISEYNDNNFWKLPALDNFNLEDL